jgi:hypothetical protein
MPIRLRVEPPDLRPYTGTIASRALGPLRERGKGMPNASQATAWEQWR